MNTWYQIENQNPFNNSWFLWFLFFSIFRPRCWVLLPLGRGGKSNHLARVVFAVSAVHGVQLHTFWQVLDHGETSDSWKLGSRESFCLSCSKPTAISWRHTFFEVISDLQRAYICHLTKNKKQRTMMVFRLHKHCMAARHAHDQPRQAACCMTSAVNQRGPQLLLQFSEGLLQREASIDPNGNPHWPHIKRTWIYYIQLLVLNETSYDEKQWVLNWSQWILAFLCRDSKPKLKGRTRVPITQTIPSTSPFSVRVMKANTDSLPLQRLFRATQQFLTFAAWLLSRFLVGATSFSLLMLYTGFYTLASTTVRLPSRMSQVQCCLFGSSFVATRI